MLEQRKYPFFFLGIIQRFFRREECSSPEPVHTNMQCEHENAKVAQLELDMLLRGGYTREEICAWVLLRDRYQHGGSDRGPLLRHLEFLKHLVQIGKIER